VTFDRVDTQSVNSYDRRRRQPRDVQQWLRQGPSLDELRDAYPKLWESVRDEITAALSTSDMEALTAMTVAASSPPAATRQRVHTKAEQHRLVAATIRRQMAAEALSHVRLALATGVTDGTVKFNFFNGWILQRLLFQSELERKPVSMRWFSLLWPRLPQRRRLMALVQPRGIYCFYSKQLINELRELIGTSNCLEIAAGDGTLTRFLTDQGARVTATDDHSWSDRVSFPAFVKRQDAAAALRAHQPEVVICSWPPAANRFEKAVFATRSVQLYIVISTRHEFSSGAWDTYRSQRDFDVAEAPSLSRLVLPPELDPAVYLFRRRTRP